MQRFNHRLKRSNDYLHLHRAMVAAHDAWVDCGGFYLGFKGFAGENVVNAPTYVSGP